MALSRREQTLVWLGLAAALLVGGWVYVVEPLNTQSHELAELVPVREARLERRRQLIAQRETLAEELERTTKSVDDKSAGLLRGPTPPLAASELQKLVKDLASQVNAEVRSERVLSTVDRGGVLEVPVEITVAGGIRQSVNLLAQLEQTDKLLTIQDVKVRVISAGQPRDLLTTITVSGYLPGGGSPGRSADGPAGSGRREAPG